MQDNKSDLSEVNDQDKEEIIISEENMILNAQDDGQDELLMNMIHPSFCYGVPSLHIKEQYGVLTISVTSLCLDDDPDEEDDV